MQVKSGKNTGSQFFLCNGASPSFSNILKVCQNCISYKTKFWIRSVCFGLSPDYYTVVEGDLPIERVRPGTGGYVNCEGGVKYLKFLNFSVIPLSSMSVWLLYSCSSFSLLNLNFNCVMLVLPKITKSIKWGKSGELEPKPEDDPTHQG